jgi:uncharacterized integral membrane protein
MTERDDLGSGPKRLRMSPGLVLWGLLALCMIVLLAQNSGDTNISFFWLDITAPLFVVIGAAMLLGWGLGELGSRVWRWRRGRGDH